jgi:hypothetical protein
MDSISHALYRAIMVDDAHQRKVEDMDKPIGDERPNQAGLQPLTLRKDVHDAYNGAAGTDLHIELERGPETLCLYMEFVAAGFCPPASLVTGATVILAPGEVSLFAICDSGNDTWCAALRVRDPDAHPSNRKAGWTEQLC